MVISLRCAKISMNPGGNSTPIPASAGLLNSICLVIKPRHAFSFVLPTQNYLIGVVNYDPQLLSINQNATHGMCHSGTSICNFYSLSL